MLVTWTLSLTALLSHVEIGNELLSSVFHGQNSLMKNQSVSQSIDQPLKRINCLHTFIKSNISKELAQTIRIVTEKPHQGSVNKLLYCIVL